MSAPEFNQTAVSASLSHGLLGFLHFLGYDRRRKNREAGEAAFNELREAYEMLMRRIERDNREVLYVPVQCGKKMHVCRLRLDHGLPSVRVKFVDSTTGHDLLEMVVPFAESVDEIEKVRLRNT